jgi:hypothetical protein
MEVGFQQVGADLQEGGAVEIASELAPDVEEDVIVSLTEG